VLPNRENDGESTARIGLAKGQIAIFTVDVLLFDNERIIPVTLLGFFRPYIVSSQVSDVGIIPRKGDR
jgi:hypothetical protein